MSIDATPTPNPDAIKFSAREGAFLERGMESFTSPEQAAGHPIGRRLFDLPGVASVFITPGFVTVTKDPSAAWTGLADRVSACLAPFVKEPSG